MYRDCAHCYFNCRTLKIQSCSPHHPLQAVNSTLVYEHLTLLATSLNPTSRVSPGNLATLLAPVQLACSYISQIHCLSRPIFLSSGLTLEILSLRWTGTLVHLASTSGIHSHLLKPPSRQGTKPASVLRFWGLGVVFLVFGFGSGWTAVYASRSSMSIIGMEVPCSSVLGWTFLVASFLTALSRPAGGAAGAGAALATAASEAERTIKVNLMFVVVVLLRY